MESEARRLLCLGFSCSVLMFVEASVLLHVVVACSFLWLYGIPLCGYALIYPLSVDGLFGSFQQFFYYYYKECYY